MLARASSGLQITPKRDSATRRMFRRGKSSPRRRPACGRGTLALLAAVAALAGTPADARGQWLAPLLLETAPTLPSGEIDIALGASYFHNADYPPFTPANSINWQDLTAVPTIGVRAGIGGMVEVQASYEILNMSESTTSGAVGKYGTGDARLFAKFFFLRERTWVPAMGGRFGVKLPNAREPLGTNEADVFLQWLGSKHLGPVTAHLNLGIALLGNPGPSGGQDDLFAYAVGVVSPTLGADAPDAWGARLLADVEGWAGSRFGNDANEFRLGVQVVRGPLTIYAGAEAGLSGIAAEYGAIGGAIYTFDFDRLAAAFE